MSPCMVRIKINITYTRFTENYLYQMKFDFINFVIIQNGFCYVFLQLICKTIYLSMYSLIRNVLHFDFKMIESIGY